RNAAAVFGTAVRNGYSDDGHRLCRTRIAEISKCDHRAALAAIDHREVLTRAHDREALIRNLEVLEVCSRGHANDVTRVGGVDCGLNGRKDAAGLAYVESRRAGFVGQGRRGNSKHEATELLHIVFSMSEK